MLTYGSRDVKQCRRPGYPQAPFGGGELLHDVRGQQVRLPEVTAAEAQPHHRMPLRPVVARVDVQPREQLLAAFEQFLQGIQKKTLAEPPRARQKVVRAFIEQPLDVGGLIHVVAVPLAQGAEGLDADRQSAPGHRPILPASPTLHQVRAGLRSAGHAGVKLSHREEKTVKLSHRAGQPGVVTAETAVVLRVWPPAGTQQRSLTHSAPGDPGCHRPGRSAD